ncbi:hypothetical protein C1701_00715 [Actinoalloteichus sp. AHMU CJ021]|uniref:BTAD domain-containing putative transcriptional regulator n=1 Tax=Actinoalloteichus sp. AHMU CJ021 TaxID=2072503 RepID=UPI000CA02863|nr:hypothetical protein C1701_00715 [Actinoalloteichus sp. AHMU CJ021]
MEFGILGPLSVSRGGAPLPVSGVHQRAVLAYLLLHGNEVIPTSRLLRTMWGDNAPRTARKMLQNAVSGLRGLLAAEEDAPILLTHAPGYLLQVDPVRVDRHAFTDLAERGRAALRAGDPAGAAESLRLALGLWRGDPLADLVELGFDWPELNVLREARASAVEDRFEAELARGRHQDVVGELELAVTADPLRERLCGLLMLAAYRCGRQHEALAAYRSLRTRLVAELGVEPGETLRTLERDILNQRPELAAPTTPGAAAGVPGPTVVPGAAPSPALAPAPRHNGGASATRLGAPAPPEPARPAPGPIPENGAVAEQRALTVVMVMTTAEHAATVEGFVCQQIRHHGGQPAPGPGSSWCGYFGASGRQPDHADRALAAAGAIARRSVVDFHPAEVRVAVHSGEAVVTRLVDGDTAVPKVAAVVLDSCRRLAAAATPGRVVLNTAPPEGPVGHGPFAARPRPTGAPAELPSSWHGPTPFVGRSFELDLLQRTAARTHATGRPAMVTLLGAPGVGKTRLVSELVDQLRDGTLNTTRVLRTRVRPGHGDAGTVLSELVRDQPGGGVEALRGLASRQPALVVVDDAHHADDDLLAALAALVDTPDPLPLMIVTTARDAFSRRVSENATGPNSLSFVLDRLTDNAVTRLLDVVLNPRRRQSHLGPSQPSAATGEWRELLGEIRGCPLRALEYAARFNAAGDDQAAHREGMAGFARFNPRGAEAGVPVPAVAAIPG